MIGILRNINEARFTYLLLNKRAFGTEEESWTWSLKAEHATTLQKLGKMKT